MKRNCGNSACDPAYELIISEAKKTEDSGVYRCIFNDDDWIFAFASIDVNIRGIYI